MAKVKCAFCGKTIDKKIAYVQYGKNKNKYFCSYEHSISKTPKQLFYVEVVNVFGKVSNSLFFGEMDKLANIHGYEKMTSYIKENKAMIQRYMNKDFKSTYGKIKYFTAILANNLDDYKIPEPEIEIKKEANIEIYESKFKPKEARKGMDDLLSDLLGE